MLTRSRAVQLLAGVVALVGVSAVIGTLGSRRIAQPIVTAPAPAPIADFTYRNAVLEKGDQRWALGQPGDVVTVGDWWCYGTATPALLRPGTGRVYSLSAWAADGQDVTADVVGHVDGAVEIATADTDGDGCDDIVVTSADGVDSVLHPDQP